MAENKDTSTAPAAPPAAEKPKITLRFHQPHEHRTGVFDSEGNETVKKYRAGDRDVFTQTEADLIRGLHVAQVVLNPGLKSAP